MLVAAALASSAVGASSAADAALVPAPESRSRAKGPKTPKEVVCSKRPKLLIISPKGKVIEYNGTECPDVAAAFDALTIPIWQPDREKPVLPPEAYQSWPQRGETKLTGGDHYSPADHGDEDDVFDGVDVISLDAEEEDSNE